jgi:uncharacterized repeat protein (TIGR03803 family)
MRRNLVVIKAQLALLSALALTACGRGNVGVAPPFAVAPPSDSAEAQPNTLHVLPLYKFKDGESAVGPGGSGGLVGDARKVLFGVAAAGGDPKCHPGDGFKGCGLIYELSRIKGRRSYQVTILHTFEGADGAEPTAALLPDGKGTFYGTTGLGGQYNKGTVFQLTRTATGYTESVLHSFGAQGDGAYPYTSVINVNGTLYGTTGYGGVYSGCSSGCGTAYSLNLASGTEQVLHNFGNGYDGAIPYASLIDVNGTLYGTTSAGGSAPKDEGCGTVFALTTTGAENVLYSFHGSPDGCNPLGSGVTYLNGIFYGSTSGGGTTMCECGIIFSLTMAGAESALHRFSGPGGDDPRAGLIAVNGSLYGSTFYGGGSCARSPFGCGVVFALTPAVSGAPNYEAVYKFTGGRAGAEPAAPLLASHGSFYGTTSSGGKKGFGTAFKLSL